MDSISKITELPVPIGVLETLFIRYFAIGATFSSEMASASLMLDWARGKKRSYAEYGELWGWSSSKVGRDMHLIAKTAEGMLSSNLLLERGGAIALLPGMPESLPEPQKSASKKDFRRTSWQYKFSAEFWRRLEQEGISTQQYRNNPETAIQNGAMTFDRLHRLDKHDQGTIVKVVKFIFHEDDWWVSSGNIQTPAKLRKKLRDGEFVFDRILNKINAKDGRKQREDVRRYEGAINRASEALEIIRLDEEAERASRA
tara:strand:+ start:14572 stop:15342 length:771 start_codon:yes stop_codon:yes gene_type:complete